MLISLSLEPLGRNSRSIPLRWYINVQYKIRGRILLFRMVNCYPNFKISMFHPAIHYLRTTDPSFLLNFFFTLLHLNFIEHTDAASYTLIIKVPLLIYFFYLISLPNTSMNRKPICTDSISSDECSPFLKPHANQTRISHISDEKL